jgi:hypothetical protein
MSARVLSIVMGLLVAGIIIGILAMIQPFVFPLFKWGFLLLFVSTLGYIVFSHINPPETPLEREAEGRQT